MENSLWFEISLWSISPKWNLHWSEFHSAKSHLNADNEVTSHQSEILSRSETSNPFEFTLGLIRHLAPIERKDKFLRNSVVTLSNFVISAPLCNYFAQLCNFGAAHFCNSNLCNFVFDTSFYNFKSARLICKTNFRNLFVFSKSK